MFCFTRRRLGKLLLMCHRLELFIEKDEPGQRGAAFDLWRFILRIKKPPPPDPRSELSGACMCERTLEQAVHLPMEHNNSQQTLRLLRSFNGALDE